MKCSIFFYVLPAAFFLDIFLGDPKNLPHPIRWMGNAITATEPFFRKLPAGLTTAGAIFSISLITGTWGITFLLIAAADTIHPFAKIGLEILLIYYSISARSLEDSALAVYQSLKKSSIKEAKNKIALIVGRDVSKLTESGLARASVETVGENLVDGVISPLFFAALGGAPLAMAYKMINTLDSMVGYKNEKYAQFGKFGAIIDDIANFIPARLSIPIISSAAQILAGKGIRTCKIALTQGSHHLSPNAGYPEAAFAGALGIRLGGPNYYDGRLVFKPFIGVNTCEIIPLDIKKACDLMMLSSLIWVGILWSVSLFVSL